MTRKRKSDPANQEPWDYFDEWGLLPIAPKLEPENGLTCWDALHHYIDESLAKFFHDLDISGYGDENLPDATWWPDERREFARNHYAWKESFRSLTRELRRKLESGELVARGFSNQAPLDAPRRPIAPERWNDLTLDVKASTASGPGIEVTQILIFAKKPSRTSNSKTSLRAYSEAQLREWYLKWLLKCEASGRSPSREDDHREAKAALGPGIPKRAVEALRRELAPEAWTRRGRRRRP